MVRRFKLGDTSRRRVFHGGRATGQMLRLELEEALQTAERVILDFSGVGVVTQSFMDELVGVLILEHGPEILQRLSFNGCNKDVRAVIRYVAASRTADFEARQQTAIH